MFDLELMVSVLTKSLKQWDFLQLLIKNFHKDFIHRWADLYLSLLHCTALANFLHVLCIPSVRTNKITLLPFFVPAVLLQFYETSEKNISKWDTKNKVMYFEAFWLLAWASSDYMWTRVKNDKLAANASFNSKLNP